MSPPKRRDEKSGSSLLARLRRSLTTGRSFSSPPASYSISPLPQASSQFSSQSTASEAPDTIEQIPSSHLNAAVAPGPVSNDATLSSTTASSLTPRGGDGHAARTVVIDAIGRALAYPPLKILEDFFVTLGGLRDLIRTMESNEGERERLATKVDWLERTVKGSRFFHEDNADIGISSRKDIDDITRRLQGHLNGLQALSSKKRGRSLVQANEISGKLKEVAADIDYAGIQLQTIGILEVGNAYVKQSELSKKSQMTPARQAAQWTPASPPMFVGRDVELAAVVEAMEKAPARIVILGPGGIGKTTFALKVLNARQVEERFLKHRYFVACEAKTTDVTITSELCRCLGLPEGSDTGAACSHMKTLDAPLLLVFDNLESAWETSSRAKVDDMLGQTASIRNVSLLVTMRGTERPLGVEWTHKLLGRLTPLEIDPCRELYFKICGERDKHDPNLDSLLLNLGGLPLAVKLMAAVGQCGASPSDMLSRWQHEKLPMLTSGDTREYNLEKCIALSINSARLRQDADAIVLLSAIAFFPAGIQTFAIPAMVPGMTRWRHALDTLIRTAVVEETKWLVYMEPSVFALPPIRAYVLEHHPVGTDQLAYLVELFFWDTFELELAYKYEQGTILCAALTVFEDGHPALQIILDACHYLKNALTSRTPPPNAELPALRCFMEDVGISQVIMPMLEALLNTDEIKCPYTAALLQFHFGWLLYATVCCNIRPFSQRTAWKAAESLFQVACRTFQSLPDKIARVESCLFLHILRSEGGVPIFFGLEYFMKTTDSLRARVPLLRELRPIVIEVPIRGRHLTWYSEVLRGKEDETLASSILQEVSQIWCEIKLSTSRLLDTMLPVLAEFRAGILRDGTSPDSRAKAIGVGDERISQDDLEASLRDYMTSSLQSLELLLDILHFVAEAMGQSQPWAERVPQLLIILDSWIWEPLSRTAVLRYLTYCDCRNLWNGLPKDSVVLTSDVFVAIEKVVRTFQAEQVKRLEAGQMDVADGVHIDSVYRTGPNFLYEWCRWTSKIALNADVVGIVSGGSKDSWDVGPVASKAFNERYEELVAGAKSRETEQMLHIRQGRA